jgi:hypothetical protein
MRAVCGVAGVAAVAFPLLWGRPAQAEGAAETVAKEAIRKAAADFAASDYATAVARLDKAARSCGTKHCTRGTKAFVLRDLGTMQFRMGDKAAASNSFAEAISLEPDLSLSTKYEAPDVRAVWDQAKQAASAGPADEQPSGDFTHTPPPEQKPNTPIPLYFEYPGDSPPARVVVKYRGARMADWASVNLSPTEGGWEGLVPCGDVERGTMRYWVQGFDDGGDPSASAGDPKHSYAVPIRDELSGEPPHLPGKAPPQACAEGESSVANDGGGYRRWWLGVAGSIEFLSMPEQTDACKLTPTGIPANASALYCTSPDGSDFPVRSPVAQGMAQNNALVPGQAGRVGGGLEAGDVRLMLSADYALRPNILVGGRLGYVVNAYPGDAASKDGRAASFRVHLEARATYLFGTNNPLAHVGFVPMGFAGAGLAEFDGHSGTTVTLSDVQGSQPKDAWRTDGPGFVFFGGGARYQLSPRAACTGAFRLNVAFGNGALLTYGPELGVAYGF